MNKLFTQKQITKTRFIFNETSPDNAEQQTPSVARTVKSLSAFIFRHTEGTNNLVSAIPVDPIIKDLCHDKIGDLIANTSNPNYAASQGKIVTDIGKLLNEGETAQAENPVEGAGQNPQQLEAQRDAVAQAMINYLNQVQTALAQQAKLATEEAAQSEDPAKEKFAQSLVQRGALIGAVASSVTQSGIDWQNQVPFGGNAAMVSNAETTIGTTEGSDADALVGLDTVNIPWCGAYCKTMCEQSGNPLPEGPNWNVAETYVAQPSATGEHVAIYCGGGEMIGGNQSNAVTKCPIPANYRFNTVTNLQQGVHVDLKASGGEPQPGDIIVTSRSDGNSDSGSTSAA